ncbi:hypothetical protein MANI_024410 [Metarhizium anisopliae]|nr:hypothetical protein MANI_024410 [Metarhizium anisopliae]
MRIPAEIPPLVARVSSWTDRKLRVLCLLCDDLHQHDFDGNYKETRIEVAPCDVSCNDEDQVRTYRIQFFMNLGAGMNCYEIDKENIQFVAGGAYLIESDMLNDYEIEKRTESFKEQVALKPPWTEATEMYPAFSDRSLRKIDVVVGRMIHGNVSFVNQYLKTSIGRDIFLHGVQAWETAGSGQSDFESNKTGSSNVTIVTSGRTALHLAARCDYPDIVEFLLTYGANVDAVDVSGRTALMEAALWGRWKNAQLLLAYGANKLLECIHNRRPRRAIDLALPSEENALARSAAAFVHRRTKEDTLAQDINRQVIVELLSDEERSTLPGPLGFAFQRRRNHRSLLSFITRYEIPVEGKTVACMIRHGGLPPVFAMSGFTHDGSIELPGRPWVNVVMRLCRLIGSYPDKWPRRDQGVPGQFYASHAEKKLIAYFIYKHKFLLSDISNTEDELTSMMGTLNLRGRTPRAISPRKFKMMRLQAASPETSLCEANVMSSTPICADCERFARSVNEVLGLRIRLCHSLA